jgi:uncharacterized SAM-binding protein YcdF (DUF218 family)
VKLVKWIIMLGRYGRNLAIVFTCFWLLGLWQFARLVPAASPPPEGQYDAIIALTGGTGRIPYALDLLKEGKARALLISGVGDGFSVDDIAAIEHAPKDSALARLKPHIFYGEKARDTIGNAQETKAWLSKTPYKRVLIVSANYHIPRVRLVFKHYLPDYSLTFVAIEPPRFHRMEWLTHSNSLRLMLSEYHKLLLSWVRYGVLSVVWKEE